MNYDIFGWLGGTLFAFVLLPQIIKTIKVKNVEGISFLFLLLLEIAGISMLLYNFLVIKDLILFFQYITGIILTTIQLILYFYYREDFDGRGNS